MGIDNFGQDDSFDVALFNVGLLVSDWLHFSSFFTANLEKAYCASRTALKSIPEDILLPMCVLQVTKIALRYMRVSLEFLCAFRALNHAVYSELQHFCVLLSHVSNFWTI